MYGIFLRNGGAGIHLGRMGTESGRESIQRNEHTALQMGSIRLCAALLKGLVRMEKSGTPEKTRGFVSSFALAFILP
jgi:hypothetical protein